MANAIDKAIGVIPARGGSKGVPHKNIRLLAGKPLIAHTIAEALKAKTLDRVVVSTDDVEIASIARDCGAEVVMRPAQLANDSAPPEWGVLHVLDTLEREGYKPGIVVTLQPTSPLRTSALIDRCVEALRAGDADSVATVLETREYFGRISDGRYEVLFKDQPRRRQEREPLYRESGTVYVTRADVLRAKRSVLGDHVRAVVVDEIEAIDINSPFDFLLAESAIQWRNGNGAA